MAPRCSAVHPRGGGSDHPMGPCLRPEAGAPFSIDFFVWPLERCIDEQCICNAPHRQRPLPPAADAERIRAIDDPLALSARCTASAQR